jgi:hypothetical protein
MPLQINKSEAAQHQHHARLPTTHHPSTTPQTPGPTARPDQPSRPHQHPQHATPDPTPASQSQVVHDGRAGSDRAWRARRSLERLRPRNPPGRAVGLGASPSTGISPSRRPTLHVRSTHGSQSVGAPSRYLSTVLLRGDSGASWFRGRRAEPCGYEVLLPGPEVSIYVLARRSRSCCADGRAR